jgi:hypothetical protein
VSFEDLYQIKEQFMCLDLDASGVIEFRELEDTGKPLLAPYQRLTSTLLAPYLRLTSALPAPYQRLTSALLAPY